ncbi:MAG: hypothetical protein ABWY63_00720 [Hyphomicrobiaceae bacterium]
MAIDPATGQEYYDPNKVIGSLPQIEDTTAAQVAKLTSQDSKLNQMSRTEGLKAANRRGLLNSSMAVEASQDALLKNVLPIASQDASQAFQKNMAAKAFEYGLTGQEAAQRFQTGERLGTQQFQTAENIAARGWQTAENIAQRGFLGTQADLDRDLQQTLQTQQIDANQAMQIRQIASTEGIESANRALQSALQEKDIQFRMTEGNLDRASAERMQQQDIAFRTQQNAAQRSLEQQIAQWNLSSNDRNAAAQMVSNMEANYQTQYSTIMNNTRLNATQRAQQLAAATNLRNTQLGMVRQMYNVDLRW